MADLLEVRDLRTYLYTTQGVVKAVDGVSFNVREGETVALVGESGCGKTMSALSIMRLTPRPQASIEGGEIYFQGRDLLKLGDEEMRRIRGAEIAMVFQEPMTSLNPVLTIGRQLTETLEAHASVSKEEAKARALEL
ncbi:MAG: oligopeptide/dipeptide ABC transporter, ATPase subunit, partial [Deltaproteobacteria bacterium]|nr:oligopeptide/dipeptide ABC transporter, ATPase subunit [Deltaproteobacteria bacterium]